MTNPMQDKWQAMDAMIRARDKRIAALEAELLQARKYRRTSHREYVAECSALLGHPRERREDGTLVFDGWDLRARCSQMRERAEKAEVARSEAEAEVARLRAVAGALLLWGNRVLWADEPRLASWRNGTRDVLRARSTYAPDWIEFGQAIMDMDAALRWEGS